MKLKKNNKVLRETIDKMLNQPIMSMEVDIIWELINELIENELDQEEECRRTK